MEKRITVNAIERETKDGRKFIAYRAQLKSGDWMDMQFTKDCAPKSTPRKFTLVFDSSNSNVSRKGFYPKMWVKEYIDIIPFETHNEVDDLF